MSWCGCAKCERESDRSDIVTNSLVLSDVTRKTGGQTGGHIFAASMHRFVIVIAWLLAGLFSGVPVPAAEVPEEVDYPLVVINAASFQRLRENAGLMFESAERTDMTDQVDQWIANTLKETKGLDRSRPFGMMLYLRPEFFGPPMGISYLPVSNLDEALLTLASDSGQVIPVEGKQNRHDIQYGESFKLRTLYRAGYLFLVGPDGNDSTLDRNFPDPEKLTSRLSSQYDLALSFMLKTIPIGLKTTFLAYFNTQSKASLQQRDDEPESVYRLRRANGEFWIELVDRIINQGQELTLGGRIDSETKLAYVDLEVAGTGDSKLAKFFQGMVGKRTYFGNLLTNPSTFTMSVSYLFEEKQRKLIVTYFEAALRDLGKDSHRDDVTEFVKIVDPIFRTLMTTAEVGHLDAIAQLTGETQGEFGLVSGVKLATSRGLPSQIAQMLQHLQDNANGNDLLLKMELDFDSIDSLPVHRLPINPPDRGGQRMFGETAYLYLYVSPHSVWCAFGGDPALESLKNAVQAVAMPQDIQQTRNRVPFQFVTFAKNWLSVADDENPNAVAFTEQAEAAFESDNDAMKLEIRPTENGVRLRFEFESGYLALTGRGISKGVDSGFFRRPPRGQRRGPPGQQGGPDQSEP